MWYILDMPNITADIESLKRDIERAHMELLQMYQELGEVSFAWHDAIGYEPSREPYGKLLELVQEKDDVDRRIEALKTAVSEMSAGGRGIEQTRLSMKELDNRFSVLISSLGAVAIEIDSAGKLPQRLRKCLEPMRDYEHKLDELGAKLDKYRATGPAFMVSVYEKKMEKVRLGLDAVFAETGRRIYNSGDFREVPGQRAKGILDEMDHIKFAKKNYKNEILDHRSMIDEAQGSLRRGEPQAQGASGYPEPDCGQALGCLFHIRAGPGGGDSLLDGQSGTGRTEEMLYPGHPADRKDRPAEPQSGPPDDGA